MASWEGFETYIATDNELPRSTALDAMELMHQFSFLCRAWIEILDRVEPFQNVEEKLGVRDLRIIENESLRLSRIQHEITHELVEIDSGDVMIVEPVRLQYVLELRERFFLERAQRMVYERLDALDRRMAVIRDVLERAYQEGSRRQGQTLQLLFAGAVAAALTALIPAVAAPHRPGLQWAVGIATAACWIVLILLIVRMKLRIEVTLQPPDEPDWLAEQPKPRKPAAPGHTPVVDPGRDRGQLQ